MKGLWVEKLSLKHGWVPAPWCPFESGTPGRTAGSEIAPVGLGLMSARLECGGHLCLPDGQAGLRALAGTDEVAGDVSEGPRELRGQGLEVASSPAC